MSHTQTAYDQPYNALNANLQKWQVINPLNPRSDETVTSSYNIHTSSYKQVLGNHQVIR